MPLIKPRSRGKRLVRHRARLDHETNETLYAYARFIGESTEYVLNQVIDTVLARDKEFLQGEDAIDLRLKAEAEALTLALVSKRRRENLEVGLGRDVEAPHLTNSAETRQQLLADLRPGARGHLAAPVGGEPIGNDLTMPVRDGHFVWMLGEMVPERLNVFQLLVRRELVKARRRKRRLRHVTSIPSARASSDLLHATTSHLRQERREAIRSAESTAALHESPPQIPHNLPERQRGHARPTVTDTRVDWRRTARVPRC
jgi:hypothetical protein